MDDFPTAEAFAENNLVLHTLGNHVVAIFFMDRPVDENGGAIAGAFGLYNGSGFIVWR